MNRWIENPLLLVGRLLLAVLFLPSGLRKLGSYGDTVRHIAASGLPLPTFGYGIAVAVEIPLALMLLLGLGTRPVAAIVALYTLATAIFFHNHMADPAQGVNFFKNLAITGGLLFVVAHGAGGWSLDRALRKKS